MPLRPADERWPARVRCRPTGWTLLGCRPVTTTPPVVLIAEQLAPSVLEVLGSDVEIRHVDGADRAALLPALADAAAVMIRSATQMDAERKSTRLNSSHANISYAVFCLKKTNLPPDTGKDHLG